MEQPILKELDFLNENFTRKQQTELVGLISNLEFKPKNLDSISSLIETTKKFIPFEERLDLYPTFIVKPDTIRPMKDDFNTNLHDLGRILIFLSENKNLGTVDIVNKASKMHDRFQNEQGKEKYMNYGAYLKWIKETKNEDELKKLIEGEQVKKAVIQMINPSIDKLAIIEDGPLVINNGNDLIFNHFSPQELSGKISDLPLDKADKIKQKYPNTDIIIDSKMTINIPRKGVGAGKCGDIENAVIEGGARFIPINDGSIFIYISRIGNAYALTDKIVEGKNGGIVFPYLIYSLPKPLLIKLFLSPDIPKRIEVTDISLKPIEEFAPEERTFTKLNMFHEPNSVKKALRGRLQNERKKIG